jgi:crotonobetainyl-CoA:carnitine CoA-transferase CaiB-like acyl-CoA transferase
MSGILDGIKVLDLSRLLPGPFCTQMLGDLGAEVLKVEDPKGGDYARWMEPHGKADSGQFLAINRNKKSMKLNLQSQEGKEIFMKLIAWADVLVEQFRPDVMEHLGLSYDTLKKHNPRLIMCSITGFGQDGALRNKAGHDINYLSITGVLDLIGQYHEKPAIPGIQIADVGGGTLWAAFSIMAALFAREKTGRGQYIDVSMTDAVFAFMAPSVGVYSINNQSPRRAEEQLNGGYAWYNVYKTKDNREIAIGMLEAKFWKDFCQAIGRQDYIPIQFGPREVQEKMMQELSEIFAAKTADEWMEMLGPLDVCASKVNNLEEALNDEHLKQRGMIVEYDHPVEGKIKSVGFPVKFSELPYSVRTVPPTFGQHTKEILIQMGYTQAAIEKLQDKGVI